MHKSTLDMKKKASLEPGNGRGRQKGTKKTGGRKAGVPNIINANTRRTLTEALSQCLDSNALYTTIMSIENPDRRVDKILRLAQLLMPTIPTEDTSRDQIKDRMSTLLRGFAEDVHEIS